MSANIASNSNSNANAYVFLCSQNDEGGFVGIAWVGETCNVNKFRRSSISEYINDDLTTAAVRIKLYKNKL